MSTNCCWIFSALLYSSQYRLKNQLKIVFLSLILLTIFSVVHCFRRVVPVTCYNLLNSKYACYFFIKKREIILKGRRLFSSVGGSRTPMQQHVDICDSVDHQQNDNFKSNTEILSMFWDGGGRVKAESWIMNHSYKTCRNHESLFLKTCIGNHESLYFGLGTMNNETLRKARQNRLIWINCVRSRECRIWRFRESNFQIFS